MKQHIKGSKKYLKPPAKAALNPLDIKTGAELTEVEVVTIIEELRVYQRELQAQNTQLRETQLELAEAHNKYLELYDFAPTAYFTINSKGFIIQSNLAGAALLKVDRRALLDTSFSMYIEPEDSDRYNKQKNLALETGLKQSSELKLIPRDKNEFPTFIQLEMIVEEDVKGREKQLWAAAVDITSRKRMEAQLILSHKLESLGLLAGGIAHDFNNILTIVSGNTALLKAIIRPDQEDAYEWLEKTGKACERAKEITQLLLTFSSPEQPDKKLSQVKDFVQTATSFALSGSNIKSELLVPEDLWWAEVDFGQLGQVINSIIRNALQAMPEGGVIEVTGENIIVKSSPEHSMVPGEYIKLSFKDQGSGIKEEDLPRIFDPYFSTREQGRGMGLAVASSIMNQHGGYITADSQIPHGAAITLYLPASKKRPTAAAFLLEHCLGTGKILIMDDEEMVREVAGNMLKLLGYEVEYASNGVEAIERYRAALHAGEPFDGVILDLTVPGGMGGEWTVQELKRIDPTAKAIVTTGYTSSPVLDNYGDSGFVAVLKKPYTLENIGVILKKALQPQNCI